MVPQSETTNNFDGRLPEAGKIVVHNNFIVGYGDVCFSSQ